MTEHTLQVSTTLSRGMRLSATRYADGGVAMLLGNYPDVSFVFSRDDIVKIKNCVDKLTGDPDA